MKADDTPNTQRDEQTPYSAWLNAGHVCQQVGNPHLAVDAFQKAIDCEPDRYEAHLAMAGVLQLLHQGPLAENAFAEALRCVSRPTPGSAGNPTQQAVRTAQVAQRMGRFSLDSDHTPAAIRALHIGLQALSGTEPAINDLRAELQIDLAEALWQQGRHDKAMWQLKSAAAGTREATLTRLAALHFRLNHWREALAVSRSNAERHPQSTAARWSLAHMLAECWQLDEAERALQQAEAMGPADGALQLRATLACRRGDADAALRIYRTLASQPDAAPSHAAQAAWASLHSSQLSGQEMADLHCELFAPLGQDARPADSFKRPPLAGRRLKLGIVSADFRRHHPVNVFMQPVLRELDRSRIEVFLYFTGAVHDDATRLAEQRVEHWLDVGPLNNAQLAQRIDKDGVDLLLDLAGHTEPQRMALFGKRAAPVQATYLGYPGSTGVPNMDWIIADNVVAPPGSDALFSEKVMRLPATLVCFAPEAHYSSPGRSRYAASVAGDGRSPKRIWRR
ncbi:hypothetical protein [Aquabacterium sp.]|uniref:O-linked N-acetylglucosamine transferase family protein n=1 Tax=Aquabacterium sp. TaxID=1872578 RepID=UPI003D00ADB9